MRAANQVPLATPTLLLFACALSFRCLSSLYCICLFESLVSKPILIAINLVNIVLIKSSVNHKRSQNDVCTNFPIRSGCRDVPDANKRNAQLSITAIE